MRQPSHVQQLQLQLQTPAWAPCLIGLWAVMLSGTATGQGSPAAAAAAANALEAAAALESVCQSTTTVVYLSPSTVTLGPMVLGRGQNGAVISLYPGVFRIMTEVRVCDSAGRVLPELAFFGQSKVDFTGSTGQPIRIVQYAIDVRTSPDLDPFEQNFAPLITSIQLTPHTASIGETVAVTVRVFHL